MGRKKRVEGKFSNKIGKFKINMIRIYFYINLFWENEAGWRGKFSLRVKNKILLTKTYFSGAEMGIQSQVQFWITKEDAQNVLAWVGLGFALG